MKTKVWWPWYIYHKLRVVTGAGNNRVLKDLDNTYQGWKTMKDLAPGLMVINESIVWGQGIVSCKREGKCISNVCLCCKNNRTCISACHRNSKCCENYDEQKLDDKNKSKMMGKQMQDEDKEEEDSWLDQVWIRKICVWRP